MGFEVAVAVAVVVFGVLLGPVVSLPGARTCARDSSSDGADCNGRRDLAWLLGGPERVSDFWATHWERKPLHFGRNDTSYFDGIYSMENISAIMDSFPDQRLHDDFVVVKEAFVTPPRFRTLNQSYHAYLDGFTTSLFIINRLWHELGRVCSDLGRDFGFPFRINMYLTPRGSRGFLPHTDSHDFFIMQMAGIKRWRVYDSPIHLPTRDLELGKVAGRGVPASTLEDKPALNVTLRPGDILYVPRGWVHEAETRDGTGAMHLTVRILNSFFFTWGHFFQYGLSHEAVKDWARRAAKFRTRRARRRRKGNSSSTGNDDAIAQNGEAGNDLIPAMMPLNALRSWDGALRHSLPVRFLVAGDGATAQSADAGARKRHDNDATEKLIRSIVCEEDSAAGEAGRRAPTSRCRVQPLWVSSIARALANNNAAADRPAHNAATVSDVRDATVAGRPAALSPPPLRPPLIVSGKTVFGGGNSDDQPQRRLTPKSELNRFVSRWLNKHLDIRTALAQLRGMKKKIDDEHANLLATVEKMFPAGLRPAMALNSWVMARSGWCLRSGDGGSLAAVSPHPSSSVSSSVSSSNKHLNISETAVERDVLLTGDCTEGVAEQERGHGGDAAVEGNGMKKAERQGKESGKKRRRRKKKKKKKKKEKGRPGALHDLPVGGVRFRALLRPALEEIVALSQRGQPFQPRHLVAAADDFERLSLLRTLRAHGALDIVRVVSPR